MPRNGATGLSRFKVPYSLHGIPGTSNPEFRLHPATTTDEKTSTAGDPDDDLARPPEVSSDSEDPLSQEAPLRKKEERLDDTSPRKRQKTLSPTKRGVDSEDEDPFAENASSQSRSHKTSNKRSNYSRKPSAAFKAPKRISTSHNGHYNGTMSSFKPPAQAPPPLAKADPLANFKMPAVLPQSLVDAFNRPPRTTEATETVGEKTGTQLQKPTSNAKQSKATGRPSASTFKAVPTLSSSSGSDTGRSKPSKRKERRGGKNSVITTSVSDLPETSLVMKRLGMKGSGKPDADENVSESIDLSILSDADREPESDSSLSDVPDDFEDADVSTSIDIFSAPGEQEMRGTRRCQICQKMVLGRTLQAFLQTIPEQYRKDHLNTRHQLRFCRFHKDQTAKLEWQQRGYPNIDWPRVRIRVGEMQDDIERIIDGTAESHYSREVLSNRKDEGGRRQNVRNEFDGDLGSDCVGYYGGQGAKVIGEVMTPLCNSKLHASKDNEVIAAAGGLGSYIQTVIVPEVASRLVTEDMKCDLPTARNILVDSADLGIQLNEELNDEVHEDEEDNDF